MKYSRRIIPVILLIAIMVAFCGSAMAVPAAMAYSATLTKTSSGLKQYMAIAYSVSQTTGYTVYLQRYINGKWENYSSSSGVKTGDLVEFSKTTTPPTGYDYRLRVLSTSEGFPDVVFYSDIITYK